MSRAGDDPPPIESGRLPRPARVLRAGETALLAEYADTATVLAVTSALHALAPAHLVDLVPAERTVLLVGATSRDPAALAALLRDLPVPDATKADAPEVILDVVYDGEDLAAAARLLRMTPDAVTAAHSETTWTVAFGGFAPGFAYLLPATDDDPAWDVPRRADPRPVVPAGAVGLASRYCGIYPRPSPGGWQLIGRTDAELFDPDRSPPALLTPGTRVRFAPQRPTTRLHPTAAQRAVSTPRAAAAAKNAEPLFRRRRHEPSAPRHPTLEVLSPGPLLLPTDTGRTGHAAIGVGTSGAFDRGALARANLAVGNPSGAAALEALLGPLQLLARASVVVAVAGASAPIRIQRSDPAAGGLDLPADLSCEVPLALDPGDLLEVGAIEQGLRILLAIRGGITGVRSAGGARSGPVLGSLSHDTLSKLGPAPLGTGNVLLGGDERGLDAVFGAAFGAAADGEEPPAAVPAEVTFQAGPRDELLGQQALTALIGQTWTVRPDSDRVGVRLDGVPLPVPDASGSLPSEAIVPGAIQVPPSGLPIVFGPDHPTTGGYPVIGVVTRTGLDRLAQAAPGSEVRFVPRVEPPGPKPQPF